MLNVQVLHWRIEIYLSVPWNEDHFELGVLFLDFLVEFLELGRERFARVAPGRGKVETDYFAVQVFPSIDLHTITSYQSHSAKHFCHTWEVSQLSPNRAFYRHEKECT